MGRWIVRLVVLIALAVGGWWWVATTSLERNIGAFWERKREGGLEVSVGKTSRLGFPFQIAAMQQQIVLTDPKAQTQVNMPAFTISSPIYWPGDATLNMPADPASITTPQGTFTLTSAGIEAAIKLHPGTTLELEALAASASDISLDAVEGRLIGIEALQADIVQGATPTTYDIDMIATGFSLGSVIRQELQMPVAWADAFEPIVVDMTVTFDQPWNRNTIVENSPQPRRIQINQLTAMWSELGLDVTGTLDVDENGVPNGEIRLKVQNWQRVFDMAVIATDIPPQWQSSAKQVLRAIADLDGTLDLPITMEGGQMSFGFFPLGPSPLLILR